MKPWIADAVRFPDRQGAKAVFGTRDSLTRIFVFDAVYTFSVVARKTFALTFSTV
jgi:hypothetical protein